MNGSEILYFKYGYNEVTSAEIKKVNLKSITLTKFSSNLIIHLKSDKLINDKVKGCNEHYTLHLISKEEYNRKKEILEIDKKIKKAFGIYISSISNKKKKQIIEILEQKD